MRLFIFGMGYTSQVIAGQLRAQGWEVSGTGRAGTTPFEDRAAVLAKLGAASHVLSSVPPGRDGGDPVLAAYGEALAAAPASWIGYLSSTGVYGDTGGAWVDESAGIGSGRRTARAAADLAWQDLGQDLGQDLEQDLGQDLEQDLVPELGARVRVFRLPGIYGPSRSALDRVREGHASRIALPGQVFSRVHVEDIAAGVIAGFAGPAGVYNLSDDEPTSQNTVIEEAARLLGVAPPPLLTLEEAALSPMARAFYAENRRVANGRAKRLLGWRPRYPTYREGLRALNATTSPIIAKAAPALASSDQR